MDGGNTGNAGAVSSASRNPGFKGDRLRRCLNRNDAAGRAAAGYFFLFGQEKVTKKKAAPEPPIPVPCRDAQMPRSAWMRESGRFSPRPGASRTRRTRK